MTDGEPREYNSPLREAQAERTRTMILDALAGVVAEEGFEGVSVREVARRCGVAERTVYRHFPDRQALQHALIERLSDQHGWTARLDEYMHDLDGFPGAIERAYAQFDEQADDTRIAARVLASSRRSPPSSFERHVALRSMLDRGAPHLPEADRRALAGVLHVLASSRTWLRLQDDFGISGKEAGRALRWLTSLVVEELHGGADIGVDAVAEDAEERGA